MPKPKQKQSALEFDFKDVAVKGVVAKGIRISNRHVMQFQEMKASQSKKDEKVAAKK